MTDDTARRIAYHDSVCSPNCGEDISTYPTPPNDWRIPMTTIAACSICHEPILRGQTMIDDHHAGCQPDVQHLWRPEDSPRAFCGDESARPLVPVPVTREESMAVPVCALCHRRAMHESYNLWVEQDPTDAEVEAAAQELWKHRALGTAHPNYPWDGLAPELRQSLRDLARAALSAARRDEEKR